MPHPLLEVAVETLPEAVGAAHAGAARLEVCGAMSEAGVTPSIGLVEAIIETLPVPTFVMIRPRGGDFCYDESEVGVMLRDIAAMKRAGAHGIVTGALEATGGVDRDVTRRLVEAADPLPVTFHRAVDLTANLEYSLDVLRALGIRRILTSGGASTALVGADMIARLVRRGGAAVTVVAGGSVRADSVAGLVSRTSVTEVHARPTRLAPIQPPDSRDVRFGSGPAVSQRAELDPDEVQALVTALHEA